MTFRNEAHYSLIVEQQIQRVFPKFSIVQFSPYVLGEEGIRRKPDLALIHNSYKTWYVVEVELSHHSLHHHVIPQVSAFVSGNYDESHAKYIADKLPAADKHAISRMVKYVSPEILVTVDSTDVLNHGWQRIEKELNAHLLFLEVFRTSDGDSIFSLSGYEPHTQPECLGTFKKHPMLNALICTNSSVISMPTSKKLEVIVEGKLHECTIVTTSDQILLFIQPTIIIQSDRNYEVSRDELNQLHLKRL